MVFSSSILRQIGTAVAAIAVFGAAMLPASAQMRQQMADKIATNAAHQFVTKINGQSCSDFAGTMSQMKHQPGATPSPMSSKLKGNTQARTDFVNIVAGPLLNKMIDCNMMPGGM